MTIIYIHGVKVRSAEHGVELQKPFRRWLTNKLAVNGAAPGYEPVYWGDVAAKFCWNLESRPKTFLLGMGGDEKFAGLGSLREAGRSSPLDKPSLQESTGPVLGAPPVVRQVGAPPLSSIPRDKRADFLADLYLVLRPREGKTDPVAEDPKLAAVAYAAAVVASDWDRLVTLEATEDARAARLVREVDKLLRDDGVVPMGGFADWISKAGETLRRAAGWPGDAVSTLFGELRPVLNEFVAYFIGDVLTYINEWDVEGKSGEIPRRVLLALRLAHARKKETGEKIIVVTHSMGGQLFYDAINYFAALDPTLKEPLAGRGGITINRALAKTITFRTIATTTDFATNYLVVGDLATVATLSAFGFVVGPFIYLGHEMVWDYYGSPREGALDLPTLTKLLPAPA